MESKTDIRRQIFQIRELNTMSEQETKSELIFQKLIHHPLYVESDFILCYVDYKGEVFTRKFIQYSLNQGKIVAVPRVNGDEMHFYQINSLSEIEEGYMGIHEPVGREKFHTEEALVVVPGVAFDLSKNRIGYGKGFYDRYFHKHSVKAKIALAYEFQIVRALPCEEHDFLMDYIITEKRIIE